MMRRRAKRTETDMENKELMGGILSRENLLRAYKHVVQNGGAAGVDGVEAFQQLGINHEWAMKFAWSRKGGSHAARS